MVTRGWWARALLRGHMRLSLSTGHVSFTRRRGKVHARARMDGEGAGAQAAALAGVSPPRDIHRKKEVLMMRDEKGNARSGISIVAVALAGLLAGMPAQAGDSNADKGKE